MVYGFTNSQSLDELSLYSNVLRKPNEPRDFLYLEINSLVYRAKISKRGLRKENRKQARPARGGLSVASLRFLANQCLEIRGKIRKIIRSYSLYQKKLAKSKLPYPPSAKEPSGGVRKGRAREGSDEGPYGRSLSVPPDYGVVMLMTNILKI